MNNKIETLENAIRHINTAIDVDPWAKEAAVEAMRYMIASLVSKPERMMGRWMTKEGETAFWDVCSNCRKKTIHRLPHFKYCPNCGAVMKEELR